MLSLLKFVLNGLTLYKCLCAFSDYDLDIEKGICSVNMQYIYKSLEFYLTCAV